MSKFKVGDLALVKKCSDAPELVGKCVELVEFLSPGSEHEEYGLITEPAWIASGSELVCMTVVFGLMPNETAAFAEHLLMPLRGDFQPEQQKAKEEEHA